MTVTPAPSITLSNGVQMPQLGLGTWPMNDTETAAAVASAIGLGYRHIDTAEKYGNETGVGEGVRQSGASRSDLFITTKFCRQWHSADGVRQACEASLKRLGMDYIDLFLMHWPNPEQDQYVETVGAMSRLIDAGLVRAIGVSNFKTTHLQRLFDADLVPHVNQIQLDPYHLRADIVAVHRAKGIATGAWSPLGRGSAMLSDPAITAAAEHHDRTPAQVVLRWQTQSGYVPIPKSSNPSRQTQNLDSFDFTLSEAEMTAMNALDRPDPGMLDSDVFGH
ncbi:MAG: aldo/keto reductase [Alcaligenaceae bacterium]|nr:aldo/keto reductase [Alcaligenaceae bacterium]